MCVCVCVSVCVCVGLRVSRPKLSKTHAHTRAHTTLLTHTHTHTRMHAQPNTPPPPLIPPMHTPTHPLSPSECINLSTGQDLGAQLLSSHVPPRRAARAFWGRRPCAYCWIGMRCVCVCVCVCVCLCLCVCVCLCVDMGSSAEYGTQHEELMPVPFASFLMHHV